MIVEKFTAPQYIGKSDFFPLYVYEYNTEGRYGAPLELSNELGLKLWIDGNLQKVLDEKRELRIVDTGDLMCFHVKGGRILYDSCTTGTRTMIRNNTRGYNFQVTDDLRVVDRAGITMDPSLVKEWATRKMKESIAWKHMSDEEAKDLLERLFGASHK